MNENQDLLSGDPLGSFEICAVEVRTDTKVRMLKDTGVSETPDEGDTLSGRILNAKEAKIAKKRSKRVGRILV